MTTHGYYRFPTIHKNTVVFVAEDDLWSVPLRGGVARRLTANLGMTTHPALSPNGKWLAFTGRDDGESEVYVMPAEGGPATRLTFLGSTTAVVGWMPDGEKIVFSSTAGQPFATLTPLYAVSRRGGPPEPLPFGPARSASFGPDGGVVIGRKAHEIAYWKRYRGGTAGDIWIDAKGSGRFKNLLKLRGNVIRPMWLGGRIYFLSDHEGVGNLYSCTARGTKITRHTNHEDYYVRQASTDGRRIIYRAGADLFVFDPQKEAEGKKAVKKITVKFHSPQVQRNRKFVHAPGYLEHYALHPLGHSLTVTARGKAFSMSNWEGAALQYGHPHGVRYRLSEWLTHGQQLVMVSDSGGEEVLEIHSDASLVNTDKTVERLEGLDIGRPLSLHVSPSLKEEKVAFGNHRYELVLVDIKEKSLRVLDQSQHGRIAGIDWSPDGKWLAYGFRTSLNTCAIKLCHVESGETHFVTPPNNLMDFAPSFDPEGRYLYFISYREFNPVYDSHYFDLNFPRGGRPYLVTLRDELPNPFIGLPVKSKPPKMDEDEADGDGNDDKNESDDPAEEANGAGPGDDSAGEQSAAESSGADQPDDAAQKPDPHVLRIDLDNIQQRIAAFPVDEGRYQQILGIKGKVLFTSVPIEGSLDDPGKRKKNSAGKGTLEMYDLTERKTEYLFGGISDVALSRNRKQLLYRSGRNLRVVKAGEKIDNNSSGFTKKSGWIKLARLRVAINPPQEWQQMFREAWRLQRDHFWSADMSSVDWGLVYKRYFPLIDRVATRAEFSDLLWEMQGELGTSHAYELGGDYRSAPAYYQGFLGADFEFDPETGGYRITHIVRGDPWLDRHDSPLRRVGANIRVGDILLAIDGRRLDAGFSPAHALVNRANTEVQLTVLPAERDPSESPEAEADATAETEAGPQSITVLVETLLNETPARYREWVEQNRQTVHRATGGRVGYVHIPDMGPWGYAEFHRYYLSESEREGLIVDVRFNRGGHVSQLLLEKLARRRVGYDQPRYGPAHPYPYHSVLGPMVALTNEYAGSDGDIFSHVFKLMGLGPLIGKRTWGGVVGIWPRHSLVDGTTTTQPEFSFWFEDVGWDVENYGTDPDIEVDIKPQDLAAGKDPQLARGLKEIEQRLAENPPVVPNFGPRPSLSLPQLPKMKRK